MNNFARMTKQNLDRLASNLEKILEKVTGLNFIKLEITVDRARGGREFLVVESQELVNYAYPKMFKSLKITNFGGGWTKECSPEFVGECDIFYLPMKYRYEHFGIGSNGSNVCIFWIDAEGNITDWRNELDA